MHFLCALSESVFQIDKLWGKKVAFSFKNCNFVGSDLMPSLFWFSHVVKSACSDYINLIFKFLISSVGHLIFIFVITWTEGAKLQLRHAKKPTVFISLSILQPCLHVSNPALQSSKLLVVETFQLLITHLSCISSLRLKAERYELKCEFFQSRSEIPSQKHCDKMSIWRQAFCTYIKRKYY